MPEFKELCDTTNPQFWEAVTQLGRDISLISVQEAKRLGGDSKVSENAATEVGMFIYPFGLLLIFFPSFCHLEI